RWARWPFRRPSELVCYARAEGRAVLLPVHELARVAVLVRDQRRVVQVPALDVEAQALQHAALERVADLGVDRVERRLLRVSVVRGAAAREVRRAELHDVLPGLRLVVLADPGRDAVRL